LHGPHYQHLVLALFRSTDYGVLMTDTSGTDLLCNPRFGVLVGMDPDSVGRLPREEMRRIALDRVKDQAAFNALMDRVDADPYLELEDDIELKAPRECCLRRHTAPVIDENGVLLGRVWTFLDVTETRRLQAESISYEKRLEERLEQQAAELQAAQQRLLETAQVQAVGTLAVGVAHDIRNILTSLSLELTQIEQSDFTSAARSQFDRLHTLTHSLLALSEESPAGSAIVDLDEIIEFVFGLVHGQAEIDGVRLEKLNHGVSVHVCGNPRRLEHLFINLIMNGLNAMAADGGVITVGISSEGERIRVDIHDSGPGIPEADLPNLFDPFFTTRANRPGLGLFSSRRIVEAHNGEISVANGPESGACVSVWLPASGAAGEIKLSDGDSAQTNESDAA
jgi:signal transduction histidine kinase